LEKAKILKKALLVNDMETLSAHEETSQSMMEEAEQAQQQCMQAQEAVQKREQELDEQATDV
jgi:hypothetical protein